LRTDLQYNPNALGFFPPHFTAYDSVHERFFVSNPTLNSIDVFDDSSESQIGSIIVPFPWGIDVAPDSSAMYAATAFGDVYLIEPGTMSVVQRFPAASLGSQGYTGIEPFILASGQVVLLGGIAALNVDGSQSFAIWDPSTNSLQVVSTGVFGRADFANIGQMSLTSDRSKIILTSADSDGTLGIYDPSTGVALTGQGLSFVRDILPTPDGSQLILTQGDYIEVHDSNTLALLGSYTIPAFGGALSATLSFDGSTLFVTDLLGNVYAYDTSQFAQQGWVPNFQVADAQQAIVLSATDDTGLVVGPIGHGVAFLDTTQIESSQSPTIFAIGFLSPGVGPTSGGTSVQAEVSEENATSAENITSGTIFVGNVAANNVSLSNSTASGQTPSATTNGPVDFTVVLPDGSVQLNPENFSFGPTIVELSTSAASADGGSQGAIFGYGLGQQPSDVTVSVGGQPGAVTQVIPSASPISPYPFPMEGVLFTIPPGTAGTSATLTVTTANGSATSATPLTYVPAVQQFPLSGASLMQGLYDPTRGILYFTDQAQIDVFSPSTNTWLSPITISYANSNSRLLGVALSPNGNTMAVSDAGNGNIYVLNPSSPNSVQSFHVSQGTAGNVQPYGLVVTNSGIVYYGIYNNDSDPPGGFGQLDISTGKVTSYNQYSMGNGDAFMRVLMSPDGSYVYSGGAGCPSIINTSTGLIAEGLTACNAGDGNEDMAISGDGSTILTADLLTDENLNIESNITYVDRDVWLVLGVYGQKLNANGSVAYTPLTTGIDVHNNATGLLAYRVALPIQIANVYDALAIDDTDGLLFTITSSGIAEINLSSLPVPSSFKARHSFKTLSTSHKTITTAKEQSSQNIHFERPHLRRSAPKSLCSSPKSK
jgi:streptogramin lyase